MKRRSKQNDFKYEPSTAEYLQVDTSVEHVFLETRHLQFDWPAANILTIMSTVAD